MRIQKRCRDTLIAVELDTGDELELELRDGTRRVIAVEKAWAGIHETTLKEKGVAEFGAHTVCRCHCHLRIDGHHVELVRWIGNPQSFYEPWELFGLRIWFDAAAALFDHLNESHGDCKPRKHVRLAVQDARLRICPVLLHPWCPLPEGGPRIEDCYQGSDCWMGPYFGADAHGGLDINHPAGTPIWAPVAFDDHAFFNTLAAGDNNNRWRGLHTWPDGSTWVLQVHHVIRLLVPERQPIAAGTQYAESAGVLTGSHEHSHFVFKVREPGAADDDEILLDPWVLFWQMYRDRALTTAPRTG